MFLFLHYTSYLFLIFVTPFLFPFFFPMLFIANLLIFRTSVFKSFNWLSMNQSAYIKIFRNVREIVKSKY